MVTFSQKWCTLIILVYLLGALRLTMKKIFLYKALSLITAAFIAAASISMAAYAAPEQTNLEKLEERKTLPIQSNDIENWPKGPAIGAQSAILMEMGTNTILYAKNIDEKGYPASTTKILTALIAMQNCALDETVTFSRSSIYDVPADGSKLGGVDTGDTILMENALYSVLVQSANEVASAVGEHVAEKLGEESFPEIMNRKAKALGCKNSNFVNANGLFDENHYTTAYDLALIGCEFFNNELLCRMSSAPSYHFRLKPADEEDVWISSKNQLYKGKSYEYKYLLGSKTGFVSQSRQTLVSAAEKDGMKLVCVVFCEETPYQFEDTISLFQYGFENFQKVSVNDNEGKYKILADDIFNTGNDPFGDSTPLMSIESDSYVILPNTASFADAVSTLNYDNLPDGVAATANYTYSDVPVGSCDIIFSKSEKACFSFSSNEPIRESPTASEEAESAAAATPSINSTFINKGSVIFINVQNVIFGILAFAAVAIFILFIISVIKSYSFSPRGQSSKRRKKMEKERRYRRRRSLMETIRERKRRKRKRKF